MNAYQKHQDLVRHYRPPTVDPIISLSELDILKSAHRFLRDQPSEAHAQTWEERLAQHYYDKLFKEYCLGDFSRYKTGAVGMRWRTEAECIGGKGQFACGNVKCPAVVGLRSWEVNFGYTEAGEKKNVLVKIRLCADCSRLLNYQKDKDGRKAERQRRRDEKKQLLLAPPAHVEDGENSSSSIVASRRRDAEDEGDVSFVEKKRKVADSDKSDEEVEEERGITATLTVEKLQLRSSGWKGKVVLEEVKSKEDDMDDYLADLFM